MLKQFTDDLIQGDRSSVIILYQSKVQRKFGTQSTFGSESQTDKLMQNGDKYVFGTATYTIVNLCFMCQTFQIATVTQ